MILLSIIVPVYNTEQYLNKCLTSITSQMNDECELIVVNDGSPDNSEYVIKQFKNKCTNFKYIKKENGGLSSARNIGIKVASGSFIWHVDSDDFISDNAISLVLNKVKQNQKTDIFIYDTYFELPSKTKYRKEPYTDCNTPYDYFYTYVIKNGLNSIWNKIIKRNLYVKNKINHYENISLGEDSSALVRLLNKADNIEYIPKPIYHYNIKSSGMSRGTKKNIIQFKIAINQAIQEIDNPTELYRRLFAFLRLKVVYVELIHLSQRKAKALKYNDYIELGNDFLQEISNIISDSNFKKIPLKYKFFCIYWNFKAKLSMRGGDKYIVIPQGSNLYISLSSAFLREAA